MDFEGIRREALDNVYAMAYGADMGAAVMDIPRIENATDDELIDIAHEYGIDLYRYVND